MNYKPGLAVVSAICLLALACSGGDVTPTPEPTPTPTTAPSPTPTPTPSPTPTPAPTPSPTPSPTPTATATPSPTPTPTPGPEFLYERAECAFLSDPDANNGALPDAECGYLVVPEDRSDPRSRYIRLHVTVFESTSQSPEPDPVVYLSGGPGQGAAQSLVYGLEFGVYTRFLESRDLVVIDQRGTGYSEPDLACPELDDVSIGSAGYPGSVAGQFPGSAVTDCRDRLISEGVDLSAYNSAESAADIDALRRALGYEEWNLVGVSYGTRLAQTVARDYPAGIRSIVFDSAYPVEADLYERRLTRIDRALTALEAECAGKPNGCEEGFKESVLALATRLDEDPEFLFYTDIFTQEPRFEYFVGSSLIDLVMVGMYSNVVIPHLPELIKSVDRGENGFASAMSAHVGADPTMSIGAYLSVQCAEEVPFSDRSHEDETIATYPELADIYAIRGSSVAYFKETCEMWAESEPSSIENEPVVVEDIPALVLAGELDPVTPPEWGADLSQSFAGSSFFRLDGVGHAVSFNSECGLEIAIQFIDSPVRIAEEDVPCLSELPGVEFIGPLESVTLVEFESDPPFAFSGLRPEGWSNNLLPNLYQRTDLGLHVLLQQLAPTDAERFLETYFDSLGIDIPDNVEMYSSPYAEWTVRGFELGGLAFSLGTADMGDGLLGIVISASLIETWSMIADDLFLPAIMAFEVVEVPGP